MPKRKSATARPPAGYTLLTAAAALGADLRPAFRVLMHLPDTRRDVAAWLTERAIVGDPAVGVYLEMAGRQLWDDWEARRSVVKVLDEHHPHLARKVVNISLFVLRSNEGYWAGWGFTTDRRLARWYLDVHQCNLDLRKVQEQGKTAVPEFMESEELWRALGPTPPPATTDPWGRALEQCRTVPGCAWVPISPEVRKELETHALLESYVQDETEPFRDTLRLAARFGHPLYTVYADLSARQEWDPAFRDELKQLDLYHARFRDPPGEVPGLQPMVGPYRVVCGSTGFWDGAGWTTNLDRAAKYPAWNHDKDEDFNAARKHAQAQSEGPVAEAQVSAHIVPQPPTPASSRRRRPTA